MAAGEVNSSRARPVVSVGTKARGTSDGRSLKDSQTIRRRRGCVNAVSGKARAYTIRIEAAIDAGETRVIQSSHAIAVRNCRTNRSSVECKVNCLTRDVVAARSKRCRQVYCSTETAGGGVNRQRSGKWIQRTKRQR